MKDQIWRLWLVALAAQLTLWPPASVRAVPVSKDEVRLEHVEMSRLSALNRRAGFGALTEPPVDPVHPGTSAVEEACGAGGTRRKVVGSGPQLRAALADLRPGDSIQLLDGIYAGGFDLSVSGTVAAPIFMCGTRGAVIERGFLDQGYGLRLRADHWVIAGLTIRNAAVGIELDGASANVIRDLNIKQVGERGIVVHNRSSANRFERNWIHETGWAVSQASHGIMIGSAPGRSGAPDASERNRIIANLIGPNTPSGGIAINAGTSGGTVSDNIFLGTGMVRAVHWIEVGGRNYIVQGNTGSRDPVAPFIASVGVSGPGLGNQVSGNDNNPPASAMSVAPFRSIHKRDPDASLVLPSRAFPYSLPELEIAFPQSFARRGAIVIVKERIIVTRGARLVIDGNDVHEMRLLSTPQRYTSIAAYDGYLKFEGSIERHVAVRSWNPTTGSADEAIADGRAYVFVGAGRMDVRFADFLDLGFGAGVVSGVTWKGLPGKKSRGNVEDSRFERNFFGAYTFDAEAMNWRMNVFANNMYYGFDPHDFSNNFVMEYNLAVGNGFTGIIFSRGCTGNVLRRNRSINNRGHGIVLDDGKVLNDGIPEHAVAVGSDHNLVEENFVSGNDIGIVVEGGGNNVVRENIVAQNNYGIRLKNAARHTQVIGNRISSTRVNAVHLFGGSAENQITTNEIDSGQAGVVINGSPGNRVESNVVRAIVGKAIVLAGQVSGTHVSSNELSGRGTSAIDVTRVVEGVDYQMKENDVTQWTWTGPLTTADMIVNLFYYHPGLPVWSAVLVLPFLSRIRRRLRLVQT
jgi:parallel beta-helix repeat protein